MNLSSAPDAIEPIVGWRSWVARPADGNAGSTWALHSTAYSGPWPVGAPLRARCRVASDPCSSTPGESCRCGIYAVHDPADAYKYVRSPQVVISGTFLGLPLVLGEVALWGRVVIGRYGWRAQYGYPRRLFVISGISPDTEDVVEHLRDYNVPVEAVSPSAILRLPPAVPRRPSGLRLWLRRTLEL